MQARRRLAVVSLCALIQACDDGESAAHVQFGGDASTTRPMRDAGSENLDANAAPALAPDAASALDPAAECAGDLYTFHAARVEGRTFSSAVAGNRFYLAYLVPSCGGSFEHHVAEGIALVTMPSNGVAEPPVPLVHTGVEDCVQTRAPALAPGRSSALSLFYASSLGTPRTQQIFLQDARDAAVPPTQLTMEEGEQAPVEDLIARLDNSQVAQTLRARGGTIQTLRVGGTSSELVGAVDGYQVSQLAASTVGTGVGDVLAAVSWVSVSSKKPGTYLRLYDDSGFRSETFTLAATSRGESSVALASQVTRGAVVFSDETGSLFLRTLEQDKTLGEPMRLTSNNQAVGDVSIVRYGIGYAIAYRGTAQETGQTVVRLLVTDELGNQARPRFISLARPDGRGLELRLANDGRLILTWADPTTVRNVDTQRDELETTIKVARLTCL